MEKTIGEIRMENRNRVVARWLLGLLLLVLFILPWTLGTYVTWTASNILILALYAAGFNILFGYSGLLSFGQAGFYAIGAYVCAKILLGTSFLLLGFLGGVLAAGLAALIIGFLCTRHTQIYFAMLTLSFGMMIHSIIWKWRDVTGGDDGLVNVPRAPLAIPGLFSIDVSSVESYYYVVLVIVALGIFLLWRMVNSPLGLALQGIRDSEQRVAFSGLSIQKFRLIAFAISGMYAGMAGSLMVPLLKSADPGMAHWTASAEPLMATLLGGIYNFAGPMVGAFILYVAKELIARYTEYWSMVLGFTVVVLVLGFRGGVVSVLQGLLFRRTGTVSKRGVDA